MLARLRHHARVRCDDEKNQIDSARARKHIFNKFFVSRNVNKPDSHITQIKFGKADVNRNAAQFLFGKTVGVNAGQSLDERSFSVVNMSCRANYDVLSLKSKVQSPKSKVGSFFYSCVSRFVRFVYSKIL